jgi:sigma-B regulation protein RsbU (phosphoserine phosphatase)
MGFLFKRRAGPLPPAIEPIEGAFPALTNAEIGAMFRGERAGGDLYDSIRVNPCRVLFGLLDVAGHRGDIQPILSEAQSVFREVGSALLAPPEANEADALTELFVHLNHAILESAGRVCSCPAFAGCYNEDLGVVCYVNAGHTPGLVRHSPQVSQLEATGLPLGLFTHATWDAPIIALEPAAALLMVSRGVVEVRSNDQEFGLDGVSTAFVQASLSSAHEVCADVLKAAHEFSGTTEDNDLTALTLLRRPARP